MQNVKDQCESWVKMSADSQASGDPTFQVSETWKA